MEFVPTFSIFFSETKPYPDKEGFVTLRDAITYAEENYERYIIRRSRYITGYGVNGNFARGMVVHTKR